MGNIIKYAHNPILPNDIFVPDVEAHVWSDGRIYLYGSFDIQARTAYCSTEYHVYSSDDMISWTDHGVSFTADKITWAENVVALYAPDCAYRDGWYYLYYCIPDGRCGVAKSQSPTGPFEDVGQLADVMGIDPAVLIDDDGQAYLYWGQFNAVRVAKLKDNMVEIEADSAYQPLSVAEHEFHEGSSVKKINGRYYYVFTDTHRHGGKATSLGYAVSDDPMRNFVYGGIIIDNFGCDRATWNDHGSIECFNGQWYVFYHRSTHGTQNSRHVCVEPIYFDDDGRIAEVAMTSSGISESIDGSSVIPACLACGLVGNACIASDDDSAHVMSLRQIMPGDSAIYRYIGFTGQDSFTLKARTDGKMNVELLIDNRYYGEANISPCAEYRSYSIQIKPLEKTAVFTLRFTGNFNSADIDEFTFGNI